MKICTYCRTPIEDSCLKCPGCGAPAPIEERQAAPPPPPMPAPPQPQPQPQPAMAAARPAPAVSYIGRLMRSLMLFCLTLFLGYFGIHKFYQKKIGMGILYLCTLGLFGVGWVIDIIINGLNCLHVLLGGE